VINKIYNKTNFHSHTFCIWKEVAISEIKELKISYTSQSGSQYIFTKEGLYRISNHWGRVANCHWRLVPITQFKNQNTTVAFAKWSDFYSNNDASKLFFIQVNSKTKEVNFYHKETSEIYENLIFRNAKETAKTVKTIKQVLTETDWTKYLNYSDLDILRKEVVNELVSTNKSFLEIKRKFQ
jgi:hypothetical protein